MQVILHDVGFFFSPSNLVCPDIVIEDGDLKADTGLQNAALISIWSNRFVKKEDLPEGETDQMGWWADEFSIPSTDEIGSQLWVTERSKILQATANRMKDFAQQGFEWMIDEGIAKLITVVATVLDDEIEIAIEIFSPDGDSFSFKYLWDGQQARFETDSV